MGWPAEYLQPNPQRDCTFYAAAYLARCLGHPDVTAQDVMDWRESTGWHEDRYLQQALSVETRSWWDDKDDDAKRRRWWLGPDGREWVTWWLDDGWVGYAEVHRIPEMYHAVAVLQADEDGVVLMDPVHGFIAEPWDWFLGIGAGTYGCHRISSWHRSAS